MNWRRRVWVAGRSTEADEVQEASPPELAEHSAADRGGEAGSLAQDVPRGTSSVGRGGGVGDNGREDASTASRPGRIVAITNQKGGVGKTTTTISLSAALAEMGVRVLLVDLDPQGNATTGLDLKVVGEQSSTYHVVVDRLPARDAVVRSSVSGLDVLPSSIDLAGAEVELVAQMNRERRLSRALAPLRSDYDVIVVDCPPSLGILTLNALVAADEAMVPIQCEYYALEGVSQLLRTVELVRADLNDGLHIGGVVLTMFDARTNLSQQVADEIRGFFGDIVYTAVIPRTVRLSEAPSFGQPITVFDPHSRGARAYGRLAREVGQRWELAAAIGDGLGGLDAVLGAAAPTGMT